MLTEVTLLHRTTSDPTDYLIAANLKIRAERLVHISRKSQSPSLFWPRALQRTIVGHVSGYTFLCRLAIMVPIRRALPSRLTSVCSTPLKFQTVSTDLPNASKMRFAPLVRLTRPTSLALGDVYRPTRQAIPQLQLC
jgi:hypothetical protein